MNKKLHKKIKKQKIYHLFIKSHHLYSNMVDFYFRYERHVN